MIRVSRVGIVHGAFVLFAVALVGRAAWVQVGQADRWRARAESQQTVETEIPAVRGAILDASGAVLVESRALVRLDIAPTEVKESRPLADALRRIGVAPEFVRRAVDRKRKWVELPGRFLTSDVEDLLKMRGVHSRPVLERVPPSTDGLRRLLGTVDRDGKAVGGMEAALDGALRGTPGRTVLVRAGSAGRLSSPEENYQAPAPGRTAVLTLHQGLQDIAERMWRMHDRTREIVGKAAVAIESHIGLFGRADARGRRADHERDARSTMARAQLFDPLIHPILLQREPRQPVVAAFPAREFRRQRVGLEAVDASDPGRQRAGAEIVGAQAAATLAQRAAERVEAAAAGGGGGAGGDRQRRHCRHRKPWIRGPEV